MSQKNALLNFFKVSTETNICSLACLKAKTEEILKKKFVLLFSRSKTVLAIFGNFKKILNKF